MFRLNLQAELNEEIEEMERQKEDNVRPTTASNGSFRGSDIDSDDEDEGSTGGLSGRAGSATHRRSGGGGGGGVSYEEFNV